MKLVTSMMTIIELSDSDVQKALEIISRKLNLKAVSSKYHYDDRRYFETDIDLLDVEFTKDTLYAGINILISAYEEVMNLIPISIDFIAGNDDTDSAILRYENDVDDIADFGLFVTKRTIPGLKPYYSSEICNAYLNLTHVSFGVY